MSKKNVERVVSPYVYDVLQKPVITEKSTFNAEQGKVTFFVKLASSKQDVKNAVEAIFGVEVEKVSILIVKGKRKLFRGKAGSRSDRKKALVTLKDGQSIDYTAGVK